MVFIFQVTEVLSQLLDIWLEKVSTDSKLIEMSLSLPIETFNVTEYTELTFLQCCFWWPFKSVLATELANVSTWIFSYSGFNFSSSNFCSALLVMSPGFYDSKRSCREKYQPIISYWIYVNNLSEALKRLLTDYEHKKIFFSGRISYYLADGLHDATWTTKTHCAVSGHAVTIECEVWLCHGFTVFQFADIGG